MSKALTLVESKAFIFGLLSTVAAGAAVFGYSIPVATIILLMTPIMIGIGAQGWSDVSQVKARMALRHELTMHALNAGRLSYAEALAGKLPLPTPTLAPKVGQAGYINLLVLIVLAAFAALASCSSWTSSDTAKAKAGGVAAAGCVLKDVMQYSGEVEAALAKETFDQALADVTKAHSLTQDAISCLVQTVLAVLTAQTPTGSASTAQPTMVVTHAKVWLDMHGVK
jgi:hypothetical protein